MQYSRAGSLKSAEEYSTCKIAPKNIMSVSVPHDLLYFCHVRQRHSRTLRARYSRALRARHSRALKANEDLHCKASQG